MAKFSEELSKKRREEILNAAKKIYDVKPFKEITLKDIGEGTSFTRTSIYNYFSGKEEIYLSVLESEFSDLNNTSMGVRHIPSGSSLYLKMQGLVVL